MNSILLKEKLHDFVNVGDEKLLKMMYALAREYNNDESLIDFTDEEIKQFDRRRENRNNGISSVHTWEEAKEMILNKKAL